MNSAMLEGAGEEGSMIKTIKRSGETRGVVYDKNMDELAVSLEVDSVYAQPRHGKVEASKTAAKILARCSSLDEQS